MSTLEQLDAPPAELPVFNGDLARWRQDQETIRQGLQNPEGIDFEAQLPEIVGHMSEEEAARLNGIAEAGRLSVDRLRENLPGLTAIVTEDLQQLSEKGGTIEIAQLRHLSVQEGDDLLANTIHIDGFSRENMPSGVTYLVADFEPTVFYQGAARLTTPKEGKIDVCRIEVPDGYDDEARQTMSAAPPLAVVRASAVTVHSSPIPKEAGTRNFIRILAKTL